MVALQREREKLQWQQQGGGGGPEAQGSTGGNRVPNVLRKYLRTATAANVTVTRRRVVLTAECTADGLDIVSRTAKIRGIRGRFLGELPELVRSGNDRAIAEEAVRAGLYSPATAPLSCGNSALLPPRHCSLIDLTD